MKPYWKTISSKISYKSKWLTVRSDVVIQPDGKESTYDVVERIDFIVVIAKKNDKFILVEQFRYPIGKRSLEFVEGGLDAGEDPLAGAIRELKEETGMRSNQWKKLGFLYLGNGNQTQGFYVYLADNCISGEKIMLGEEADMIVKEFTLEELKNMITKEIIQDSPTVAAFCYYLLA